jgi:predicted PurR-regulated permease PerM
MASYINYTKEQELFTKNLQALVKEVQNKFPDTIPPRFVESFRKDNKPLMPITNILTFNTRSIVLFASVLSGYLLVYWLFELIILSILLIYMVLKQEKISKKHLQILKNEY